MIYFLDFRGADVGGPVVPGRVVPVSGLTVPQGSEDDLRLETKVTFLFHGYNVDRKKGIRTLQRLAAYLASASDGAIVVVLWPGDHWIGALSYPLEGRDADDSAAQLARYIDRVVTPGAGLSFVSHSLGGRVAMETVKRLGSGRYNIRQVCLMAAATDDFCLARLRDYRRAVESCDRVAVLASRRDKVLRLAYPVGDLLQGFIFARDRAGLALGYHGPKPYRGEGTPERVYHAQIPEERDSDHGHYLPDKLPDEAPRGSQQPLELRNQRAAARFADQVLQGDERPRYV